MKKTFVILMFLLVMTMSRTGTAFAQDSNPPTDDEVNAIAKELFCPVCENTPLDVCPTEACKQWRDLIRLKLTEGWTEAQIKQYFVDQYGARVLSEPPRQGWYWLIYIVPVVILLAGVYILARAYRSMRMPVTAEAAPLEYPDGHETARQVPVSRDSEYLRRVEEELKKRD